MGFRKFRQENEPRPAWRDFDDQKLVEELVKLGMDSEAAKEYAEFDRNALPKSYKDRLPK